MIRSQTSVAVSISDGHVAAGEADVTFVPRVPGAGAGKPPVLFMHGANGHAFDWVNPALPGTSGLPLGLLRRIGCVGIAADYGLNGWGDETTMQRMDAARTYATQEYGCRSDKVILVGGSMGGLNCWNYARRAGPGVVAALLVVCPVTDLTAFRNANTLNLDSQINAAYGIAAQNPLPATADPALNTATIKANVGSNTMIAYSTGDTVVPPSTITTMVAALQCQSLVVGTMDHGDLELLAMVNDIDPFAQFLYDRAF